MSALEYVGKIALETCCNCGTVFGMQEQLKEKLLENGNTFYCPNGHPQAYTNSKTLKQKLAEKENEIETLKKRVYLATDKGISSFVDWRFYDKLKDAGVQTIGDALELGESGLRSIYGIGNVCIQQIKEGLEKYNINLKS